MIYLYIVGGVDIIYQAIKVGDISIYGRRGRHYIPAIKVIYLYIVGGVDIIYRAIKVIYLYI